MWDSEKLPIGFNVKDKNFQNLVILGNFWNGLMLILLGLSLVSKSILSNLEENS